MTEALVASQILVWVAVVGLALSVWALARQVGVLHERIAPMGAMMMGGGAEVGERAPELRGRDLEGKPTAVDFSSSDGKSHLLLFISNDCPVCKKIAGLLKSFARAERDRIEVVLVGEGVRRENRAFISRHGLEDFRFVLSPMAGAAYGIGKLPYAVLVDSQAIIRTTGLVNTREHLESLVIAEETGYSSLDAYLEATNGDVGLSQNPENHKSRLRHGS